MMVSCDWCEATGYRDDLSSALCRHCNGKGLVPLADFGDDGQPDEQQEWADYDRDC